MISEVEDIFMGMFAICISSLEKCLFSASALIISTPKYVSKKKNKNTPLIQKDTCTPTCTAALFIIAKIRKQHKCQSTDEQIEKNGIYVYWASLVAHQ